MGSVKLKLYIHKKYKDGRHPVMLRITHDRASKYFGTNASAFMEEWDIATNQLNDIYKKNFNLNRVTFDTINLDLSKRYNKAREIITNLESSGSSYTLYDISKHLDNHDKAITFFRYTQKLIDDLMESGKIGNASNYQTVLNNVKHFVGEKDFALDKLNYRWLCDFEKYHLSKPEKSLRGNAVNGLNVYMRAIRAILNRAIKEGLLAESSNPFGKKGYDIQNAPVVKRAINKEKIDTIKNLDFPENTPFWHTKNYFLFSFYCRGMSWTDIAHLKLSNIIDGRIEYVRIKTIRKNAKTFSIKITEQIQQILDCYVTGKRSDDYVFPIIDRDDIIGSRKDVHNRLKTFNKHIKKIAKMCGIEKKMTSYVARHSWGTIAKKELHIDTALISEGYGHRDEATTKAYLDDFDHDDIDEMNDLITR